MTENVRLTCLGKRLRKPWYAFWHVIEKRFYLGREYCVQVPHGQRIYTPWYVDTEKDEFSQLMCEVNSAGPVAVTRDRSYVLYQAIRHALGIKGEIVECGVYTGSTAHLLAATLARHGCIDRTLHLFDTFSGMPSTFVSERDYHKPGDFGDTSLAFVQHRLATYANLCRFHPGFMPDTFTELAEEECYAFVHIDVDIKESVRVCCEYFWPRLSPGGIMIFDDYGFFPYRYAARAAVDAYFTEKHEKPFILPTGQAMAIKLPHEEVAQPYIKVTDIAQ